MSHGLCLPSSFDLKPTAVAVALALTVGPASAATIVADEVTCSLIDAIVAANSNSAVSGCTAGDDVKEGGDVIVLNADVVLASIVDETDGANGLPSITSLITIEGNGHAVSRSSVSGTPEFRLLHVGPAGELTLNDLGLYGGQQSYGGGLANSGTTTLRDSVISGNGDGIAGGVYNTGTLTLVDSEVSQNWGDFGGGIANLGTLTLERSSVSGNSAYLAAGGIHNSGILTITNSSISDNGTT
jgi:hypothetical protein